MDAAATKLLLIDDEAGLRRSLRFGLNQLGYEIDESEEGLPALQLIESSFAAGNPYGYVIADISLPDINGLKLLEVIKSRYPELPVIVWLVVPEVVLLPRSHLATRVFESTMQE